MPDATGTTPGPEKTAKVLTCGGVNFPLDKSVLPRRVRVLLREGKYEAKEATALRKLVRKGDVVMELGGGIGYMSTLAATRTPAAAVHAFEANPGLIPYIRRVHELNGAECAQVHHGVLGPQAGEATFHVRENLLASSLTPDADAGPAEAVQVPMLDMNAEIARIRPTVLVCDIEGAEADLLPQMDLSGFRAAVIETHPQWIGKAGIRKVFACLDAAGLVFFPRWSHGKVAVFRSDW
ncbi:FkbM family methyltransferase [Cribrihabitans neustonicus]|uniref:FkbM family methyltransferase n=1 Tax=Cribrihabitans neustonicus TaxID=1429085 RepID=UPI003B5A1857